MKPPEVEFMLLGALLDAGADAATLVDLCPWPAQQLYDPRVRVCWELIRKHASRRLKIDAVTIWSAGKHANLLSDDDRKWLESLQATNTVSRDAFGQLADDMRRHLSGRSVIEQMRKLAEHIKANGLNAAYVAGAFDSMAHELAKEHAPDKTAGADLLELIAEPDRLEKSKEGQMLVVPTGIKLIDEQISGYVPTLNMILGDPSIGKNTFVGTGITQQALSGLNVGVFALDEGARFLSKRNLARILGIQVRTVGTRKWTEAENEKLTSPELVELHRALDRVQIYEYAGITADELVHRATRWVIRYGVKCIYVDHIGEIRHRTINGESPNWAVADSYRKIRDFARRYSVPVVMLAHRKPDARGKKGPPDASHVGLTGEAEKMVRLMLGLWKRGQSLRCTLLKMNEGSDEHPTWELDRLFDAALVKPDGGQQISLEKEKREEAIEKKARAWEEQKEATLRREQWNAQRKPKKTEEAKPAEPVAAPAPPPQMDLLQPPPPEAKP